MNTNSITSPSAARYRGAAATALRQAIAFRTDALARCSAFDRYIDRKVMRTFALEWRFYVARAQQIAAREERACGEPVESAA